MAVKIRLKRLGRANRPYWRICATDRLTARDGRVIEELGHYDPLRRDQDKVSIDRQRVVHWLKAGATPSDTVADLLAHLGLDRRGNEVTPRRWKAKKKRKARKAAAGAAETAPGEGQAAT